MGVTSWGLPTPHLSIWGCCWICPALRVWRNVVTALHPRQRLCCSVSASESSGQLWLSSCTFPEDFYLS